MKDWDSTDILLIFIGVLIGLIITEICYPKLEKENKELKMENERLQKIVKELDREQAERTRITAEKNGVGG